MMLLLKMLWVYLFMGDDINLFDDWKGWFPGGACSSPDGIVLE